MAGHPPACALDDAALALLAATSLDDLVASIPPLVQPVLDAARCEVLLADSQGQIAPPRDEAAWHLSIPLRHGGALLGTLALELPGGALPDGWDEARAGRMARLIAAAIDQQRRIAAEQARLRADATGQTFELVAILSHEMRTPLAAIKGYATALMLDEASWSGETREEFLQAIDEESDRLTQLITDILDSSVIAAGELRVEPEPILLPPMVRRVIAKLAIHAGKHRFVLSFPAGFQVVEADEHRIDQVLTNLIDNAVKYSPDGGLIVVSGEVTGDEVIVRVADQGIGIAPEHLNKLFERYFRATADGRAAVIGTGLGLPITDAIIRAHGGRIWAESTVGRGTTFSFTLPLCRPARGGASGGDA